MQRLLVDLQNHPNGWPFLTPVNAEEVTDYYDVIKQPMGMCLVDLVRHPYSPSNPGPRPAFAFSSIGDPFEPFEHAQRSLLLCFSPIDFSKMESKLEANAYANFEEFVTDAYLVFSNCLIYNPETTTYAKQAIKMEKFVKDWVVQRQAT